MSRSRRDHPDMRDDSPGRIPESLIDAAMDGELDPEIQKEIGRALQYDPVRKKEFHDTRDAINALRMPIDSPDLSDRVLERAHRHRRFIPRKLRQQVRVGRVVMAGVLLTTMLGVAGLQRTFPRLTTFGAQSTPVSDIEHAVEQGTQQLAQSVSEDVHKFQACMTEPVRGLLAGAIERPGASDHEFGLTLANTSSSYTHEFSETHALSYPGYAFVTLATNNAQAQPENRRAGYIRSSDSSRVVLMSWVSSSDNSSKEPTDFDDALTLP